MKTGFFSFVYCGIITNSFRIDLKEVAGFAWFSNFGCISSVIKPSRCLIWNIES